MTFISLRNEETDWLKKLIVLLKDSIEQTIHQTTEILILTSNSSLSIKTLNRYIGEIDTKNSNFKEIEKGYEFIFALKSRELNDQDISYKEKIKQYIPLGESFHVIKFLSPRRIIKPLPVHVLLSSRIIYDPRNPSCFNREGYISIEVIFDDIQYRVRLSPIDKDLLTFPIYEGQPGLLEWFKLGRSKNFPNLTIDIQGTFESDECYEVGDIPKWETIDTTE